VADRFDSCFHGVLRLVVQVGSGSGSCGLGSVARRHGSDACGAALQRTVPKETFVGSDVKVSVENVCAVVAKLCVFDGERVSNSRVEGSGSCGYIWFTLRVHRALVLRAGGPQLDFMLRYAGAEGFFSSTWLNR
jgi:hypothetical protein